MIEDSIVSLGEITIFCICTAIIHRRSLFFFFFFFYSHPHIAIHLSIFLTFHVTEMRFFALLVCINRVGS